MTFHAGVPSCTQVLSPLEKKTLLISRTVQRSLHTKEKPYHQMHSFSANLIKHNIRRNFVISNKTSIGVFTQAIET